MTYFKYGKKEIEHLKNSDKILGQAIDEIGMVKRRVEINIFEGLISSIISQQISTNAALTVKSRLKELLGEINPHIIDKTSIGEIQKCGMSHRKADYIKGIAEAAINGIIEFDNLSNLEDQEIIRELTRIKGVGEWTVEMLLIHSLERPNILSYKDLGIRRGIMKLYGLSQLSKEEFEVYRKRYSPYGTTASIYLWEIASK
ncbi:MAG TPA: DNA-3-methyladenine glycosylase 2 family protein [Eubacteriaceae bacterium]|nr:DNA-3-methyladenine glycosylase 2 family protein [Eubacteriaceae bacterium]